MEYTDRGKWEALAVLGVAYLMVVLDISIVNVALPSIETDLKFSPSNLQWVVSAYSLTFGGFCCSVGVPATCSAAGGCSWPGLPCSPSRR
jgi:MFS family permease